LLLKENRTTATDRNIGEFCVHDTIRRVARNLFWGIIFYSTILQPYNISSLTTSAAIRAQNFHRLILGGYIYRHTASRYAPGYDTTCYVLMCAQKMTSSQLNLPLGTKAEK